MKKLFALLLALVLALSLAACGEAAGDISSGINAPVNNDASETGTQDDLQDISEVSSEISTETTIHTHSYATKVTAPTCTERGFTTYTCDCGDTYQADETAATGHTYADATCRVAATCHCGATEGAALGHNYVQGKCTRCNAADPDYAQPSTDSQTVYITETGKKYHTTEHCPGLANAKAVFESTLSAAKDKNLTPCARCH